MNKKVIVSIIVFIFLGLFIWTFANPNEENKDKEPQQEGNNNQDVETIDPVVETDQEEVPLEVPAPVVPVVDNTQNDLNDANNIGLLLTPSTTGPTRSVVITLNVNTNRLDLINEVNYGTNNTCPNNNNLTLNGNSATFIVTENDTYTVCLSTTNGVTKTASIVIDNITNTNELEDAIEKGEEFDEPRNEELEKAIEEGKDVLEDNEATQEEIDDATDKINDLIDALNITLEVTSNQTTEYTNQITIKGNILVPNNQEELIKNVKYGKDTCNNELLFEDNKFSVIAVENADYHFCLETINNVIIEKNIVINMIDLIKPSITTDLDDNKISIRMNNTEFNLSNLVSVNKNDTYSDLEALQITSLFDITTKNTYEVKYNVSDKVGNKADELTINVEVTDASLLEDAITEANNVLVPINETLNEIYDRLVEAIEEAEAIIEDENATKKEIDDATDKINVLLNELDDAEQEIENNINVSLTPSNENWTNSNVELTISLNNEELIKNYKVVSGTSCEVEGLTINNKKVNISTEGENTYTLCVTTKHDLNKTANTTTKIDKTLSSITTDLNDNKISIRMNNTEFNLNNLVSVNKNDTYSDLEALQITSLFDITTKNTYEVKYNVFDKAGNNADELTINVEVTDASLLNTAINNADTLYNNYKDVEDLSVELNALKDAIDAAVIVLNDNYATQQEIDDATEALNTAIEVFSIRIDSYTTIIAINPSSNNGVYERNASMNNISIIATYKDNHTESISGYQQVGTFTSSTVTTAPREIKYTYEGLETTYYYTVVRNSDDQTLVSIRGVLSKITYNNNESQGTLSVFAKDKDNTEYQITDYQITVAFDSSLTLGVNQANRNIEISYTKNDITKTASVSYSVVRPESEIITGIIANVKTNKQLAFTKDRSYNIKDYLDVYYINNNGSIIGDALTNDEYRVDNFRTSSVGTKTLKVVSNYNQYNTSLEYLVTTENVNQNKFQVRFMADNKYLACSSNNSYYCGTLISKERNNNFLEIEENYLEGIILENVKVTYTNNTSKDLKISDDEVRFSKYSNELSGWLDPVYLATLKNKDVMNSSNIIKTVEIEYHKKVGFLNYDKYTITFEYKDNQFVAISEVKERG